VTQVVSLQTSVEMADGGGSVN